MSSMTVAERVQMIEERMLARGWTREMFGVTVMPFCTCCSLRTVAIMADARKCEADVPDDLSRADFERLADAMVDGLAKRSREIVRHAH